jgi:hypothetical protein
MANTTIPSELIADGSVVTAKIANDAVDADKLASNAVVTASIADDAVTLAKMTANSVDSDQYVDGSIDTIHIADGAITSAKLDTNIAVGGTLTVTGDANFDSNTLFVDASANSVGIGTSSPTKLLEISDSTTGDAQYLNIHNVGGGSVNDETSIQFQHGGTRRSSRISSTLTSSTTTNLMFSTEAGGSVVERLRIDSSGRLLIGHQTAKGYALDVDKANIGVASFNRTGTDGEVVSIRKDGTTVGSIGVGDGDNLYISGSAGSTKGLIFNDNSVIPAANGYNVSDNTTNLGSSSGRFKNLYLSGEANIGSVLQTTSSTGLAGNFENTNTSGYGLRVTTYATGAEYGLAVDSYGGGYSRDFTVGADGNVNVLTGNLVIGTAGKGIDFSATSGTGTSELLDDYEEGTWTPVTNSGSWNIGFATYTKIGNMVTCRFQVVATSTIAANDFTGLPFTPAEFSAGVCGYQNSESAITYGILVQTPSVWNFRHGSTQKGVTNAAQVFGMFSYRTTA